MNSKEEELEALPSDSEAEEEAEASEEASSEGEVGGTKLTALSA